MNRLTYARANGLCLRCLQPKPDRPGMCGPCSAPTDTDREPTGTPPPTRERKHRTCTYDGCTNPHNAKGLCITHYQRARRTQVQP